MTQFFTKQEDSHIKLDTCLQNGVLFEYYSHSTTFLVLYDKG